MVEDVAEVPTLPKHLNDVPGVQLNQPSSEFIQQAEGMIQKSLANVAVDKNGQLLFIAQHANGKTSVNFAVAAKVGDNIKIVQWIGKTWGSPLEVGVAATWQF